MPKQVKTQRPQNKDIAPKSELSEGQRILKAAGFAPLKKEVKEPEIIVVRARQKTLQKPVQAKNTPPPPLKASSPRPVSKLSPKQHQGRLLCLFVVAKQRYLSTHPPQPWSVGGAVNEERVMDFKNLSPQKRYELLLPILEEDRPGETAQCMKALGVHMVDPGCRWEDLPRLVK